MINLYIGRYMDKAKEKTGTDNLKLTTLRVHPTELEAAKTKAKAEGRNLSVVLRQLLNHWLSGKYNPFDD